MFRRNPLVIAGNSLSSGERTTTFPTGNPDALLRSYLIFVRDMRGQRREPSISLRSEDIAVLADHLGATEEYVLGGLLDLMGATQAQRSTMLAMLAAGALTVVLSGTIVSSLSTDGVSVEMDRLAAAVQSAASGSDSAATAARASDDTPNGPTETAAAGEFSAVPATPIVFTTTPVTAGPELTASTASDSSVGATVEVWQPSVATPAVDVMRSAAAAASGSTATTEAAQAPPAAASNSSSSNSSGSSAANSATEPVSVGIAPDGSLVGSIAPPVPATPDEPVATAELADGSTVGVAAPPVPPPPATPDEPVATAELPDGSTVGVVAPPVPPAPPSP